MAVSSENGGQAAEWRYGRGKPHIFKVRNMWIAVRLHDGIQSSWTAPTFADLRGWLA